MFAKNKLYNYFILSILVGSISFFAYLFLSETNIFRSSSEIIYRNCLIAMKDNTCSIMQLPLAQPQAKVFIAGVGEVDMILYQKLRSSPVMCETLKSDCKTDLESPMCLLGKSLFQD